MLKISIEDVWKYHGDIDICAVVGFRATQLAISQLWKDEIPKRGEFKIISAFPGKGSQDAFEFITRAKTRKDFALELPEGTSLSNISMDNWVFTFIQKSTSKQIKVWLKEEAFPGGSEDFFKLRKKVKFEKTAAPEEKKAFKSAKQELKKTLMSLPLDKLFGFKLGMAEVTREKGALSPILIHDRVCFEKVPLKIFIEDIRKYRGNICPGVVISFRATQLAISQLWRDEIPRRGDFKIISALPTGGSKDAFEFITRVITRNKGEDFKIEIPRGTDMKKLSKDNFTFTFIRKSTNEQIKIRVKEAVFPEGFFELMKNARSNIPAIATPDQKRTFKQEKQKLVNSLLYFLPEDKVFDFEIISPD